MPHAPILHCELITSQDNHKLWRMPYKLHIFLKPEIRDRCPSVDPAEVSHRPSFHTSLIVPIASVRLQSPVGLGSVPLNVALFPATPNHSGAPVATSGPYSNALCGVLLATPTIAPGRYWLVPSTFHPGQYGEFQMMLYSTRVAVEVVGTENV